LYLVKELKKRRTLFSITKNLATETQTSVYSKSWAPYLYPLWKTSKLTLFNIHLQNWEELLDLKFTMVLCTHGLINFENTKAKKIDL
jgi:hypothetical protein